MDEGCDGVCRSIGLPGFQAGLHGHIAGIDKDQIDRLPVGGYPHVQPACQSVLWERLDHGTRIFFENL